jgi:hypothetical protein
VAATPVGSKLLPDRCNCNPRSVPHIEHDPERLGTSTGKELHVLCYQHHTEMLLRLLSEPAEGLMYACREPGCLVRYDSSAGYFIDTEDANTIEQETTPHVSCSNDGQLMYLAEVSPQRRSFRLWKCPLCNLSYINDEETSGRLGKKMGA